MIKSKDSQLKAILIHHSVGEHVTVEFGEITIEHPLLATMTPVDATVYSSGSVKVKKTKKSLKYYQLSKWTSLRMQE